MARSCLRRSSGERYRRGNELGDRVERESRRGRNTETGGGIYPSSILGRGEAIPGVGPPPESAGVAPPESGGCTPGIRGWQSAGTPKTYTPLPRQKVTEHLVAQWAPFQEMVVRVTAACPPPAHYYIEPARSAVVVVASPRMWRMRSPLGARRASPLGGSSRAPARGRAHPPQAPADKAQTGSHARSDTSSWACM